MVSYLASAKLLTLEKSVLILVVMEDGLVPITLDKPVKGYVS